MHDIAENVVIHQMYTYNSFHTVKLLCIKEMKLLIIGTLMNFFVKILESFLRYSIYYTSRDNIDQL